MCLFIQPLPALARRRKAVRQCARLLLSRRSAPCELINALPTWARCLRPCPCRPLAYLSTQIDIFPPPAPCRGRSRPPISPSHHRPLPFSPILPWLIARASSEFTPSPCSICDPAVADAIACPAPRTPYLCDLPSWATPQILMPCTCRSSSAPDHT